MKYLSWSITATRDDGKTDNLTVSFGLDENLSKMVEKKLDEIEKFQRGIGYGN